MKATQATTTTAQCVAPIPNVNLSPEQQEIVDLIKTQILSLKSPDPNFPVPKSIIVQGKAVTGKSMLIKYITALLENEFGQDSYILGAPTGAAAVLINGRTIHSIFQLPKYEKYFNPLTGSSAHKLTQQMKNVKYILIDEFSMIGASKLAMVDMRCKEATGNFNEPFGGLHIMLLGDIKQLPPVKDTPYYSKKITTNLAKHGVVIFKAFEKTFILETCFRQNDSTFLQMLDKLSNGYFDVESYELISQRFSTNITPEDKQKFDDAMRLFATKNAVKVYNMHRLRHLKEENGSIAPVIKITAKHNIKAASLGSTTEAEGLAKEIFLSKGCKIMLKHNLWVEKKLVNGTIGYVHDILFDEDTNPSNGFPSVILCHFPSYTGPSLIPGTNIIPISSVSASWTDDKNNKCTRQQFPIVVAYACTIHSAQGMTLDKVVINIEDKEFSGGLSYVGFSRVRSLNGLLIHPFLIKLLNSLRKTEKNQA